MLNVELNEYGVDRCLKSAVSILRSAVGRDASKRDKDSAIKEAIGIISAVHDLIYVHEEFEEEETCGLEE